MMENIKSKYFIQFIFSFIFESNKLGLVKYNKNLQNKLGINLINYKFWSGKYIIYKINGNGKEYDSNDDLIYEGEYLNGERNGKGNEYRNGNLIFKGEYLNGERNGKGKEYFNNKLLFEGEYYKGTQWIGKLYDCSGKIINELKREKSGRIKEYFNGKLTFDGEFLNNERN